MSESREQSVNKENRKTPKTVFWVFGFIVFAILAFYLNFLRLDHLLANKIAELRKNNCPTNFDELAIWYLNGGRLPKPGETPATIDDKENAAIPFKKAFALLVDDVPATKNDELMGCVVKNGKLAMSHLIIVGGFPLRKYRTTPLPQSVIATSEAYLNANHAAMLKIEDGFEKARCYHHELTNISSISNILNILSQQKSTMRLFSMKSRLALKKNNNKEGVKAICDAAKFITKCKKEPFVISWLMNACSSMIYSDIEWILNKTTLNDNQLSTIAQSLKKTDNVTDLTFALKTEPVFIFSPEYDNSTVGNLAVKLTHNYIFSKQLISYVADFSKATGISTDIKLAAIDVINSCIEASTHPYPVAKKIIKKAKKELSYKKGVIYGMKELFSSLERTIVSKANILAKKRICLTSIAVERYRLAHKKLPDSLNELVPEFMDSVPLDPFNGKQLKYKISEITLDQAVIMTKSEIKKHPKEKSDTFRDIFLPPKTDIADFF